MALLVQHCRTSSEQGEHEQCFPAYEHPVCSDGRRWMLPGALTLTATKRLLDTATGAGRKGGCTRYCSHRTSAIHLAPRHRPFPITWTDGTEPERPFMHCSQSGLSGLRWNCIHRPCAASLHKRLGPVDAAVALQLTNPFSHLIQQPGGLGRAQSDLSDL
jgi:hypothetical protein